METNRTRKERIRGRRRYQRQTVKFLNGLAPFPRYPKWIQAEMERECRKAVRKEAKKIIEKIVSQAVEFVISKILASPEIKAAVLAGPTLRADSGGIQIGEPRLSGVRKDFQAMATANNGCTP